MKITILTYGSRGDVQPFIPLSLGLMAHGHSVQLAAPSRFKELIEEQEINFVPLKGDPAELSRYLNDSGNNFIKMTWGLISHAIEIGADVLRQTEEACSDADLIVHTFMHAVGAHTLVREKNIPDVHVQLFPMFTPTGDYPNIAMPDLRLRFLNRWTHRLSHRVAFWTSRMGYRQLRYKTGLPNRKLYSPFDIDPQRLATPILCAWSPIVIPPSTDWPQNVHVTGYLFGDSSADSYQPADELQNFLDAGDSPVCVSFGSMLNRDAKKINHIVREALQRTGNRAIILSGWNGVQHSSSKDVLHLDAVPHQWLLPRCKLIIHHGGAGTTAAGLRAGIPNIIVSHAADQPFWGTRVHAIGAGPKPIQVKKLSVQILENAVIESESHAIRGHAYALGQALRSENGVSGAVGLLENYSQDFLRLNV